MNALIFDVKIKVKFYMYSMHHGEIYRLWGRLRALPVADKASNKEWQRSKFDERERVTNFGYRNRTLRSGFNEQAH